MPYVQGCDIYEASVARDAILEPPKPRFEVHDADLASQKLLPLGREENSLKMDNLNSPGFDSSVWVAIATRANISSAGLPKASYVFRGSELRSTETTASIQVAVEAAVHDCALASFN